MNRIHRSYHVILKTAIHVLVVQCLSTGCNCGTAWYSLPAMLPESIASRQVLWNAQSDRGASRGEAPVGEICGWNTDAQEGAHRRQRNRTVPRRHSPLQECPLCTPSRPRRSNLEHQDTEYNCGDRPQQREKNGHGLDTATHFVLLCTTLGVEGLRVTGCETS